jgi:bacterial/archaeal transporter family protein
MWFLLSLIALSMLVLRRSTEKSITGHIPASSMAWLQQLIALPFMLLLLPLATIYNPFDLSLNFYLIVLVYSLFGAVDVILYFKAIEVGDISIISPLLTLAIVSSFIGTYIILGQQLSLFGAIGSGAILLGAFLTAKPRKQKSTTALNNRLAIGLILIIVVLRGIYSPLEVIGLRDTNAIYFNMATSLTCVPIIMFIMYIRGRRKNSPAFNKELFIKAKFHKLGLLFIGLTYTINMTCSYAAKMLADNAAYVTTIKSAQVLPMALVGVFLFKEKIIPRQWLGLGFILVGLAFFALA